MLIAAKTEEEHDKTVLLVLERAKRHNIKFNLSKLQFKRREVIYHGTRFSAKGIRADKAKIRAIEKMPEPQDRKGIQRLLGMINFLSPFIPHKATLTEPLRQLVKEGVPWNWGEPQKQAMNQIKQVLSNEVLLKYFDESKPLTIQADASKDGLGACLLQNNRPICYASRPLSDAETRYAQIEKELLAIVFATQWFHHYIYGATVTVHSDHKPLEAIHKKDLNKVSPRLQLMLLKLLRYSLLIEYKPGNQMYIADTLSRAYVEAENKQKTSKQFYVHPLLTYYPAPRSRIDIYKEATLCDKSLQTVRQYLREGWPSRTALPIKMIPFYDKRQT